MWRECQSRRCIPTGQRLDRIRALLSTARHQLQKSESSAICSDLFLHRGLDNLDTQHVLPTSPDCESQPGRRKKRQPRDQTAVQEAEEALRSAKKQASRGPRVQAQPQKEAADAGSQQSNRSSLITSSCNLHNAQANVSSLSTVHLIVFDCIYFLA